jgi:Fe-S-cluster-containing dehydrogenase component
LRVDVHACTIPTDEPESDGTAEWDSTTIVIVEVDEGIGYTYCEAACAQLIREKLADLVHVDVR